LSEPGATKPLSQAAAGAGLSRGAQANLPLKAAIIGGGKACDNLLTILSRERLHLLNMEVLGVADPNPQAPGMVRAREMGIFTTDDDRLLTNGPRLPLVIAMTCLNGFFHDASPFESLADALLKAPNGGAIAVFASSGLTSPEEQIPMNHQLIRLLFNGQSLPIGEAARKAKAATNGQDVRKTWILFGDPTTRLRY